MILDEAIALFDNGNYSGQTIRKMLRDLKEKMPGERTADDVLQEAIDKMDLLEYARDPTVGAVVPFSAVIEVLEQLLKDGTK